MRILIATDTTPDLFSGATTQLHTTVEGLRGLGHEVLIIDPRDFYSVESSHIHKGFHFALYPRKGLKEKIENYQPEAIHIYTECGVGIYMRHFCKKRNLPFTTSYLTRLDMIMLKRFRVPISWTNVFLRWFHQGAATMTVSIGIKRLLEKFGFKKPIKLWHPGVHTEKFTFNPNKKINQTDPTFIYFGRIDVEKNLEAFLDLDLPGRKWVAGSGGEFDHLKEEYASKVTFWEISSQEEIDDLLQKSDVLVFPSTFDTFGIVLVEAMSAGVPVAAFHEAGPEEIITNHKSGVMDPDLKKACLEALLLKPIDCHHEADRFSIRASVNQFLHNLEKI
ncbi:MAG: glycosyltransferase [Chlamydiia bacterium]